MSAYLNKPFLSVFYQIIQNLEAFLLVKGLLIVFEVIVRQEMDVYICICPCLNLNSGLCPRSCLFHLELHRVQLWKLFALLPSYHLICRSLTKMLSCLAFFRHHGDWNSRCLNVNCRDSALILGTFVWGNYVILHFTFPFSINLEKPPSPVLMLI